MRTLFFLLLLGTAISLGPTSLEAEPSLHVKGDSTRSVKTGGVYHLWLEIAWMEKEADYRFTQPELTLEHLEVEEAGETNEVFQQKGEAWRKKTFHFKLRGTQPEKGKIHPLQIHYVDPLAAISGQLEMGGRELSVVPDRSPLYRILAASLGLTLMAGVSGLLVLKRLGRKKPGEAALQPTLEEQYLPRLSQDPEQLSEVEKAFRAYLAEKYSFSRGGMTHREIIGRMEGKVNDEELKTLGGIFDKLDEWRFNDRVRSVTEQRQLCREMIRFVEGKKIIG